MTQYNNSYNADGLYGDPEGDPQEAFEISARKAARARAAYFASPFCSIDHCQNHTGRSKNGLCTHHFIQTLTFGIPEMWVRK